VDVLRDITPEPHHVAEEDDQIQEGGLPAPIWSNQRLKPVERPIDKLEASKMTRLKPCEHL